MACNDVLSLERLEISSKHDIFHNEVITGKAGGLATGADIDTTTNAVTGQVQTTLPKTLRDVGFKPGSGDFTTGFTVLPSQRDTAWFNPVDKNWYAYLGVIPSPSGHMVIAGTDPTVGGDWKPVTENILQPTVIESARRSYAEAGYNLVDGSFQEGFTLASVNDVALDWVTGKAFSGAAGIYPAATSTAGFADRSGELIRHKTPMYASDYVVAGITTDQADELQSAMELAASRGQEFILDCDVYVQERNQTLDGTSVTRPIAIYVPSGLQFRRTNDSEIIQLPTTNGICYTINFYRRKNIAMYNPVGVGDRDTHLGTTGEAGHVFNITGAAENVRLYNPVAKKAWGDGFYTGTEFAVGDQIGPTYALLHEPVTEDCSRNGISRCGGRVDVIRPRNIRVNRIAPMAGIDLEPECADANGNSLVTTGIIESPYSEDCGGYGFQSFINKGFVDVNVTGVSIDRGSKRGLYHKVVLPAASAKGQVVVDHFRSYLAKGAGAYIENIKGFTKFTCNHLYVEDSNVDTVTGIDSHPLRIQVSFSNNYAISDITIGDYSCRDTRSVPKMTHPYVIERLTAGVTTAERLVLNVTSVNGLVSKRPILLVGISHESNKITQEAYVSGDWGGNNFNLSALTLSASLGSAYTYTPGSQGLTLGGCKITKAWVDGQLNLAKPADGSIMYLNNAPVTTGVRAGAIGASARIWTIPGTFTIVVEPLSGTWVAY